MLVTPCPWAPYQRLDAPSIQGLPRVASGGEVVPAAFAQHAGPLGYEDASHCALCIKISVISSLGVEVLCWG